MTEALNTLTHTTEDLGRKRIRSRSKKNVKHVTILLVGCSLIFATLLEAGKTILDYPWVVFLLIHSFKTTSIITRISKEKATPSTYPFLPASLNSLRAKIKIAVFGTPSEATKKSTTRIMVHLLEKLKLHTIVLTAPLMLRKE